MQCKKRPTQEFQQAIDLVGARLPDDRLRYLLVENKEKSKFLY